MEDNSVVINTKIQKDVAKQLNHICKKKGISHNELLRSVVETLTRYMSDTHNLTPEIEQAMSIFEHMDGWRDAFCLCDPNAEPEVIFAVYFLQDQNGKKGIRSTLIEKPYFGIWTQTENVNEIFERTFCTLLPEQYKRLRKLGTDLGTNSVLETIVTLISMYGSEAEERIYREIFEDANRSEFGLKPHEGAPFRKKKHRNVDDMPGLDFKPFDVEP